MIAVIEYLSKEYQIDLSKPINISIPLKQGESNVNAWYIEPPKISPVQIGDWIGPGGCLLWNPDDQNLGQATSDVQATQF